MLLPSPLQPFSCSFSRTLSGPNQIFLNPRFSNLSLTIKNPSTLIRMGGGPRTFPGGVSKWQWKRMQAKKAKQLLKARLCRERQIYEMRKRAELKAAISELERPWEVVERAPNLFSVSADEQVKVLADRFQKPGGFDMWSERDGPQLFDTVDELPSARFFPKGVVHSVKPYKRITESEDSQGLSLEIENGVQIGVQKRGYGSNNLFPNGKSRNRHSSEDKQGPMAKSSYSNSSAESSSRNGGTAKKSNTKKRNGGSPKRFESNNAIGSTGLESERVGFDINKRSRSRNHAIRSGNRQYGGSPSSWGFKNSISEVYEMSLEQGGTYGFQPRKGQKSLNYGTENSFELDSY